MYEMTDLVLREDHEGWTLLTLNRPDKLNADMTNRDITKFSELEPGAAELLNAAAAKLNISARAYMRAVKVARTIADLEQTKNITAGHISEALAYRNTSSQ